jgi:hypothetical protein
MYLYTFEQRREPSEHGIGQSPPVSPWPHRAKWTDFAAPGTADTYTLAYSKWVASNYQNYNKVLLQLVPSSAVGGIRISKLAPNSHALLAWYSFNYWRCTSMGHEHDQSV